MIKKSEKVAKKLGEVVGDAIFGPMVKKPAPKKACLPVGRKK
jgi:hypothetical protein